MKNLYLLFIMVAFSWQATSQQITTDILSTAGNEVVNGNTYLTWTLGDIIAGGYQASGGEQLLNGFQNPSGNAAMVMPTEPTAPYLNFDGCDDEVSIPHDASFDFNTGDNMTLECWIYWEGSNSGLGASGSSQVLIQKSSLPFNLVFGVMQSGANVNKLVYSNNSTLVYSNSSIALNTWTHVALTHASDGTYTFYVDGVPDGTGNNPLGSFTTTEPLFIGSSGGGWSTFKGNMDEVRVWNDVRIATEIANNISSITPANEPNLLAFYEFNHPNGTTVITDSKNNHDGTWLGSGCGNNTSSVFVAPTGGTTAEALDLDGPNDFVTLPSSANPTGAFTVEFWAKPNTGGGTHPSLVSSRNNNSLDGFIFYLFNGNNPQLWVANSGGGWTIISSPTNVNFNQWQHWAGSYDGVGTLSFYIDGSLIGTTPLSSPVNTPSSSLFIGKHGDPSASPNFNGQIDELRIWNTARTECEIAASMNCELSGSETNLTAYYQFNQGNASANNAGVTTLTDITSNGNDGTLSNFALNSTTSNWVVPGGVTTGTSCTAAPFPTAYAVTGSGSYACGGTGLAVGLANSETCMEYQLNDGTNDIGSPIAGTGSAISFGNQLAGTYTVEATNVGGSMTAMTGNAVIVETGCSTAEALNFDGSNGYVIISGYQGIEGTASRTVEFWMKTSVAGAGSLFTWGSNGLGERWGGRLDGNKIRIEVSAGYLIGSTNLADGQYHHIAVVFEDDGTPNIQDVNIYIDGLLETISSSLPAPINTLNSIDVQIGRSPFGGTLFNGNMDEFRIWNRALCESEVQNYMNCELAGNESGLTAYYQFNQGNTGADNSGITTLIDLTSNGYDGTLTGFALTGTTSNWIAPGGVTTGANCTAPPPPTAYNVTGSGSYACGGTGLTVGLDNTENCIEYQLNDGTNDIGSPITGTGSAISFGDQLAGTYTVEATNADGVMTTMTGNAVIVEACCLFYVDDSATGNNDGSSWTDAYTDLQSALTITCSGITQIQVAAGTYKPTSGTNRLLSFIMKDGVEILGGYPDGGGTRDWAANPTILSGDIGTVGDNSDNSFHIIVNNNNGLTASAILDGFTITDGHANGSGSINALGAGMYNNAASPTVINCIFTGNESNGNGCAMYNLGSAPTVTNCTFSNNEGGQGVGMWNQNSSSPTITDCAFSNNTSIANGCAMYNHTSSSPIISNCRFSDNTTTVGTAGIQNYSASSPTFTNCIFFGNSGNDGAMLNSAGSSPTLTNCTIADNTTAVGSVGAIFNNNASSPTLTNCILWNNGGTFELFSNGGIIVNYSIVEGGFTGTDNSSDDPIFVDALNGDYSLDECSKAINAGDDVQGSSANTTTIDLVSNPRFYNSTVIDMGAYEYQAAVPTATAYAVTGSDTYTCGGTGLAVGLTNSELCVDYQLTQSGSNLGSPIAGIGSAISFGNQLEGTYTVVATNVSGVTTVMTGSAVIVEDGCPQGEALDFDGINDYTSIPINSDIQPANITLEAWVNPSSFEDYKGIISMSEWTGGTHAGYLIYVLANGHVVARMTTTSGTVQIASSIPIPLNTWTHIAAVNDGNTMQLYINGIAETSKPAGDISYTALVTTTLDFGRFHDSNENKYFNGKIDEVRIWDHPLSQCEVQNNMNCELGSGQTGLVAYCQFNQGNGGSSSNAGVTTLTDISGNGYDGTLNNFALTGASSNWVAPGGVTTGTACTAAPAATAYAVTGSGSYACGSTGLPVGFANSETCVEYQLNDGTNNIGSPITGTGAAISFGDQLAGTYTVEATNADGATMMMTGSAVITEESCITCATPATESVVYDFESLSSGDLHGQDNWFVHSSYSTQGNGPLCPAVPGTEIPPGIDISTATGSYSSSNALVTPNAPSTAAGGQHAYCSRKNDSNWSFPSLEGKTTITLEADMFGNHWGKQLRFAFDDNNDGNYSAACKVADVNEIGFGFGTATSNLRLFGANGAVIASGARPSNESSSWTRIRLVVDLTANNGQGAGSLFYKDHASSGSWVAHSIANINMGFDVTASGRTNFANLDGIVFDQEAGGVSFMDNISIEVLSSHIPLAYNVTGSGIFPCGGAGLPIGLDNSEIGVNYQLNDGTNDIGSPVAGTGSAISFGDHLEGTYTVEATSTGILACTSTMTGSVVIIEGPCTPAEALNFDGVNDEITTPLTSLNPAGFTVEAWVNLSTLNTPWHSSIIISKWNGGGVREMIIDYKKNNNTFSFVTRNNTTGAITSISSTTIVSTNTWYHVAGTYDGTTLNFYVNGVLEGTANSSNAIVNNPGAPIVIGGTGNSNESEWLGSLDEMRIWDRPLCESKIQNQMNCELVGNESGLVAYYQFNQGFAGEDNTGITTLTDQTGNGYDGTLNGFALTGTSSNWIAPGGVTTGSTCTALPPPTAYNVTGSGGYPCGGTGVAVGLDNSETCIEYQLNDGTNDIGSPITGTGSTISLAIN